MFFALEPRQLFELRGGGVVLHKTRPVARELRLEESMIAFEFMLQSEPRQVFVGLEKATRERR